MKQLIILYFSGQIRLHNQSKFRFQKLSMSKNIRIDEMTVKRSVGDGPVND